MSRRLIIPSRSPVHLITVTSGRSVAAGPAPPAGAGAEVELTGAPVESARAALAVAETGLEVAGDAAPESPAGTPPDEDSLVHAPVNTHAATMNPRTMRREDCGVRATVKQYELMRFLDPASRAMNIANQPTPLESCRRCGRARRRCN